MTDPYLEAALDAYILRLGGIRKYMSDRAIEHYRASIAEIIEAWVGDRTLYRIDVESNSKVGDLCAVVAGENEYGAHVGTLAEVSL